MFGKHDFDAVVVGGGPVGLYAGLCLAGRGLEVEVLDGRTDPHLPHHPVALGPRALERLDALGLLPALTQKGRVVRRVAFERDGARLGHVDVEAAGGAYPFLVVIGYDALESALEAALSARHARRRRHHELEGLTEHAQGVVIEVAKLERVYTGYIVAQHEWEVQRRFEERARFVVAADGAGSLVRRRCEIPLRATGAARTWEVFELCGLRDGPTEMVVRLDDAAPGVYCPLPEDGGAWLFARAADDGAPLDAGRFRTLLGRHAAGFGEGAELRRAARVTVAPGLAEPPGRRRVWLAGDAAHPADLPGARSLNAAFAEVHDLTDHIAARAAEDTTAGGLDAYVEAMRARWTRAPVAEADAPPWARAHADQIAACLPGAGPELDRLLAPLGLRLA